MDRIVAGELDWDSDFWGYKVGKIEIEKCIPSSLQSALDAMIESEYQLIYLFSDVEVELPMSSSYEMILTDIKRSYVYKINSHHFLFSGNVKIEPFEKEAYKLYSLGYQSGFHSRYNIDPNISNDDFKRLYRKWIDNSVNKSFADYVFVAKDEDKIIGFITARISGNYVRIGLIATDKASRGKGVGTALIQSVIREAKKKGLDIEVTTQRDNDGACLFYEKQGFSLQKETFVYHIWNKGNKLV